MYLEGYDSINLVCAIPEKSATTDLKVFPSLLEVCHPNFFSNWIIFFCNIFWQLSNCFMENLWFAYSCLKRNYGNTLTISHTPIFSVWTSSSSIQKIQESRHEGRGMRHKKWFGLPPAVLFWHHKGIRGFGCHKALPSWNLSCTWLNREFLIKAATIILVVLSISLTLVAYWCQNIK